MVGEHNARVQRRLEVLTAYDNTLKYRKGNANGNADFLCRLPQPATELDRTGPGRSTYDSRTPGIALGGLVPTTGSAAFGGLPLTTAGFRNFHQYRPRTRVDDLNAPTGRSAVRIQPHASASYTF